MVSIVIDNTLYLPLSVAIEDTANTTRGLRLDSRAG